MTEEDNILVFPDQRSTRADAVKNRELLLETAHRLFREFGVETVSMTQIAQAAGVGKGTLYRHFNNKVELSHALLHQDMLDVQDKTLKRLNQRDNPLDTLQWFLIEVARFVDRNSELLQVSVKSGIDSGLDFPAHVWWRQTIRGLLARMQTAGDLDYLSDVLYVLLDVNTIRFQRYNLRYSMERIETGLIDTLHRLVGCR